MSSTKSNDDKNKQLFQERMQKTLKEYNKLIFDSTSGNKIIGSKSQLLKKFDELKKELSQAEKFYLQEDDLDEFEQKRDQLKGSVPSYSTPPQKRDLSDYKESDEEFSEEKPTKLINLMHRYYHIGKWRKLKIFIILKAIKTYLLLKNLI